MLTATNGPAAPERAWIRRATTSLPLPLSPVISTVEGVAASLSIRSRISRIGGLSPIRSCSPACRPASTTLRRLWSSIARRRRRASSSAPKGLTR